MAVMAMLVLGACASGASTPGLGRWGDVRGTGGPGLTLAAGGTLTGTDGCNTISGTWTATGTTVEFSDVTTSRLPCPSSTAFWVLNLRSAVIEGTTMHVLDADGTEIGTLDQAAPGT